MEDPRRPETCIYCSIPLRCEVCEAPHCPRCGAHRFPLLAALGAA